MAPSIPVLRATLLDAYGPHKSETVDGFTKRYGVHRLVYVEFHATMSDAITREKQIKKWRRSWKLVLIEEANPQWQDLHRDLLR
jgi:putative endonuclease